MLLTANRKSSWQSPSDCDEKRPGGISRDSRENEADFSRVCTWLKRVYAAVLCWWMPLLTLGLTWSSAMFSVLAFFGWQCLRMWCNLIELIQSHSREIGTFRKFASAECQNTFTTFWAYWIVKFYSKTHKFNPTWTKSYFYWHLPFDLLLFSLFLWTAFYSESTSKI